MYRLKAEIRSYNQYIKYRKRLNDKLDEVWYELTGVKGIRYDKAHFSPNSAVSDERRLMLLDMVEWYNNEVDRVTKQIEYAERILGDLPEDDRKLIEYTLIQGHSYRQAENKFFLSRSGICKKIDKILEKEDVSTN